MRRQVAVISEIIAPYRIPVFNALARRDDVAPRIIFLSETDKALRQWQVYREEIKFDYEVLPSWRTRVGSTNVLFNRQVGAALRRARPDAVICGGYNYLASWSAALWARRNHVPLLLWSESTGADKRRAAALEALKSRFLKLSSGFIAAGISSRAYLLSLGAPAEAIFTAPDAVDNDLFARAAAAARQDLHSRARLGLPDRYFLFSGRLVSEKGIFDLLDAYAKLDRSTLASVGLVFAGEGQRKADLLQRAKQLELDNVHCLGFQDRDALGALYGLADALVFPTHTDPWGLVVNEAMACGLPIITISVAGCAADLVHDGDNGFVIPPRDSRALTAAMLKLAGDAGLRLAMGRRSRERIAAYSPEACAAGMAAAVLNLPRRRS
jgi:glycosyltransferase involved in cell wall biosynthesis